MKQLMLAHAFKFVNRVIFVVGKGNVRSQKAMQKIGGILVGSSAHGGERQSFVYEITRADYTI
jgi:RimJ/RimL family protein N-acetyltransferase